MVPARAVPRQIWRESTNPMAARFRKCSIDGSNPWQKLRTPGYSSPLMNSRRVVRCALLASAPVCLLSGIEVRAQSGAVEVHAEDLALVVEPIAGLHLFAGGQVLRAIDVAVVRQEVGALITARQVQLGVGSDDEAAAAMIVVSGQMGEHVGGRRQRLA